MSYGFVELNPGLNGSKVAADIVVEGGISKEFQRIKMVWGPEDTITPINTGAGALPSQGADAHDAPVSANPVLHGGRASAAAPADVSADGDIARAWFTRAGAAVVALSAAGVLLTGDATFGLDVDVTRVQGTVTVDSELPAAAALADNMANPTAPFVAAALMGFDGTTWDRLVNGGGVQAQALRVTLATDSPGAGDVAVEDAATPANPTGSPLMVRRRDTPTAAEVSAEGDFIAANASSVGAQYVELLSGSTKIPGDAANGIDVDVTRVQGTVTVDSELPAAAALADNTANPTVPGVGAFLMGWDAVNSNWDRLPIYIEDDVAPANPTGFSIMVRTRTTPTTEVSNSGDFAAASATTEGALYTRYQDDVVEDSPANANPRGEHMMARAHTALVTEVQDGDGVAVNATVQGALFVQQTFGAVILGATEDAVAAADPSGVPTILRTRLAPLGIEVSAAGDNVAPNASLQGEQWTRTANRANTGTQLTATGNVDLDVNGCAGIYLTIGGTFVATIVFEGYQFFPVSGNGAGLRALNLATGALETQATAAGNWFIPCGGVTGARMRVSSYTSGTVFIDYAAGLDPAAVHVTDGGGSITVDGTVAVSGTSAVQGVTATDAPVTENPLLGGGRASNATPSAVSADGDKVPLWLDRQGATIATGYVAHDAGWAGYPLLIGGYASDVAPAGVSNIGDAVRAWYQINGAAMVEISAAGARIGGDATNGLDVDVTRVSGTVTVQGTAAVDAPATGNPEWVGGRASTAQPTAVSADNDIQAFWLDRNGRLHTVIDQINLTPTIQGNQAHDGVASAAGNPVFIGAFASATAPTAVSADADIVQIWANRLGSLQVGLRDGTGDSCIDDASNSVNVRLVGTIAIPVVGLDAADAAITGNPLLMGGRASTATPTAMSADGDAVPQWLTREGASLVRPVPVDSPTQTSVAGSASSVTILAANTGRYGATVYNDSTADLFLKLGGTASATSFSVKMGSGGYYEVPFGYTGVIDGIWASATGNARITEIAI